MTTLLIARLTNFGLSWGPLIWYAHAAATNNSEAGRNLVMPSTIFPSTCATVSTGGLLQRCPDTRACCFKGCWCFESAAPTLRLRRPGYIISALSSHRSIDLNWEAPRYPDPTLPFRAVLISATAFLHIPFLKPSMRIRYQKPPVGVGGFGKYKS